MQDKTTVSNPSETTDRVVSGATSTLAASVSASVVPIGPAQGAVTVTVAPTAPGHAAVSVTAAPARDADDPFINDDAMDTREDRVYPNFSSVRVPHPFELQEPNPRPTAYFVVNVGIPVGIIGDVEFSSIDILRQPQLAFTRCDGWYEAVGFYTINFRNRNIRLVPLSADAPRRPTNLQRVAIMEHASGPLPPPAAAGSASNPIYVGSPDAAIVVAVPAQNPVTPTPPVRSTLTIQTGPFRIPVAIPVRKVARGETRIRRRPKRSASNTTAMTAPAPSSAPPAPGGATSGFPTTAAPTTAPTTAAPTVVASSTVASTTVASTVAASGSTSGAAPTTGVSTAFSSSTASAAAPGDACTCAPTVDASNSGSATNASYGTVDGTQRVIDVSDFSDIEPSRQVPQKRQAQDIIPQINVHDSDSDGPDFLPSYPQERGGDSSHVCRTTTPPTTDCTASISTSTSSPLTELGPTAPSTPKSGQKVFQPLFSIGGVSCKGKGKGKGKGKAKESSPVTEHLLRSNKRYKLTDAGRSLCLSGADPSSLCTNIPTADGADPVAGPSSVPANGAPTVDGPPIAGPSNCRVSNTSIEDGNDGDDEGDSLVNNEYAHWDFNSDEIDEVGRIMEEVEGAWKHRQAKRK